MAAIIGLKVVSGIWEFEFDDGTKLPVKPVFDIDGKIKSFIHPNNAWIEHGILEVLLKYCLGNQSCLATEFNTIVDEEGMLDLIEQMNPPEDDDTPNSSYRP
ncbi:hypothetical protein [Pantoea septica]|uniref:hypothetical protein n=1 Tax=Pantoea septica TaxID=472695 RepID=UPI0023F264F3|nr:hypothetical protein [Pantoea septica]